MINEIIAINILSEPGAISELTFRPSSGQHGTIPLNLFAVHLGTAWTTKLYINFINRINYFFRWPVFLRIIFFRVRDHLGFFLHLSLSWGIFKN